jgi:crossover junction endodeoxyribonuclease RusA
MMNLTLPWPPTANTYWRHPTVGKLAGRHLISEQGREYRAEVVRLLHGCEKYTGPIAVHIMAYMPDRRRRDLDNLFKSLLDSLTHAGVWDDDSQICDLRITKAPTIAGMVKVQIFEFDELGFSPNHKKVKNEHSKQN